MATLATIQKTHRPGLIHSIKVCFSTWIDLLRTRIEIISTELEEAKERLEQLVLLAVVSIFCISFGLLLLTLFVVLLFWDTYRLPVLGGFAVLYLGIGIAAVLSMKKKAKETPKIFSTTMAELAKDRDHIAPRKS
jgi:uncharacterized membrane protein YqjE